MGTKQTPMTMGLVEIENYCIHCDKTIDKCVLEDMQLWKGLIEGLNFGKSNQKVMMQKNGYSHLMGFKIDDVPPCKYDVSFNTPQGSKLVFETVTDDKEMKTKYQLECPISIKLECPISIKDVISITLKGTGIKETSRPNIKLKLGDIE